MAATDLLLVFHAGHLILNDPAAEDWTTGGNHASRVLNADQSRLRGVYLLDDVAKDVLDFCQDFALSNPVAWLELRMKHAAPSGGRYPVLRDDFLPSLVGSLRLALEQTECS